METRQNSTNANAANNATPKTGKIQLPSMKMERVMLRLVGITPLMVNNFSNKAKQEIADKQQGKATAKKAARDPEAEYNGARIVDSQGRDCIKSVYVKKCCLSSFRYIDTFKRTGLTGAFFVEGDLLPLEYGERVMDESAVRIAGGTTTLRYRPKYLDWSVRVSMQYQANFITLEQMLHMVSVSGLSIGLCEWRPEKDGDMGRFKIDPESVQVEAVSP